MHLSSGKRLPIVGVMGSGTEPHAKKATWVGEWLATLPVHLLTGGGDGAMAATSRAFHGVKNRRGCVIGILPGEITADHYLPCNGYPNPWVEIPIRTHLPLSGSWGTDILSRNHLNVLTSDVIIALPGSAGTMSEISLAKRYGKPLIAFLDSPNQLPMLPDDVPVTVDFVELQDFVIARLDELK